jgi:ketosteroid isomerase-like protein
MSEARLQRVFDVLGAADVDALPEIYADDYVLELPYRKPEPVRVDGLAAAQDFLRRSFEGVRFTLRITEVHELADTEGLVAEYTSDGNNLKTGGPFANRYIGLWLFRDGLVRLTREYYDPMVAIS